MIKIFTYRVSSEEQINTIKRLIKATLDQDPTIYNIPQYSPSKLLEDGDTAISFGTTATLSVRDTVESKGLSTQLINLPAPKDLINQEGNEKAREQAWDTLAELKSSLSNNGMKVEKVTYTENDLPELHRYHVLALQKLLEKSGRKFCLMATKNGKSIAIGETFPTDLKVDIKISFEELYTIRNTMDILGLDNVSLVNLE